MAISLSSIRWLHNRSCNSDQLSAMVHDTMQTSQSLESRSAGSSRYRNPDAVKERLKRPPILHLKHEVSHCIEQEACSLQEFLDFQVVSKNVVKPPTLHTSNICSTSSIRSTSSVKSPPDRDTMPMSRSWPSMVTIEALANLTAVEQVSTSHFSIEDYPAIFIGNFILTDPSRVSSMLQTPCRLSIHDRSQESLDAKVCEARSVATASGVPDFDVRSGRHLARTIAYHHHYALRNPYILNLVTEESAAEARVKLAAYRQMLTTFVQKQNELKAKVYRMIEGDHESAITPVAMQTRRTFSTFDGSTCVGRAQEDTFQLPPFDFHMGSPVFPKESNFLSAKGSTRGSMVCDDVDYEYF